MKTIFLFILIILRISSIHGQQVTTIHIQTKMEKVKVWDYVDEVISKLYYLVQPSDSIYLDIQNGYIVYPMGGGIQCHNSYSFQTTVPDGMYKIYIDNQPQEITTIKDGKRNGLTSTYKKRPLGQSQLDDKKYWFVQTFKNDLSIEYYKIDKKGRVQEFCPQVRDCRFRPAESVTYHFDRKGRLRRLAYGLGSFRVNYFSKNGKYLRTELPHESKRYKGEKSERYIYDLNKINLKGMEKNQQPSGQVELSYYSIKLTFHFEKGVLLKWSRTEKDQSKMASFWVSSAEIGRKRMDLLNFCLN